MGRHLKYKPEVRKRATKYRKDVKLYKCDFCKQKDVANNIFKVYGKNACRDCYYDQTHSKAGLESNREPIDFVNKMLKRL
jgi:hypothetical protein